MRGYRQARHSTPKREQGKNNFNFKDIFFTIPLIYPEHPEKGLSGGEEDKSRRVA